VVVAEICKRTLRVIHLHTNAVHFTELLDDLSDAGFGGSSRE
jgi:hypothetical protein